MPTFSIVIPNFNHSYFLKTALESLKYQQIDFNLAVVDGGSSDNFHDIIGPYSDIITYVRSSKDNGQSDAIREGTEKIKGDILSWLNADDYYFPGALEKVASIFQKHPDIDVVYGDAIHVSPEGFFQSYFPAIQQFDARELMKNNFICQPACFYSRSIYEKVGEIDSSLHYTMDWDLWCRFASYGAKFYYLHEPLAAVRYYRGTKTLSGNIERYREIYRIEKKYGKRFFKTSVIGGYYDLLVSKSSKRIAEMAFIFLFNFLRRAKNSLTINRSRELKRKKLLYGFQRLDPYSVEGRCKIRMPWYGTKKWKKIKLKVIPRNKQYRVRINGESCNSVFDQKGNLVVDVLKLDNPDRVIEIECHDQHRWRLERFSCDLNDSNPRQPSPGGYGGPWITPVK